MTARSPVWYRWLAVIPPLGLLAGPFVVNRVRPFVLGLPLLLAWCVAWVFVTSATMALIFALDRARRQGTAAPTP